MLDSSRSKLLLVESEPLLADLTSFRLELLGYQIECLGSGSEAVTRLSNEIPDLLIVGTTLRDGDSIEQVARLRNQYPAEQLPILVCSLDPSLETVERAFAAGAQDYLITPFDPAVLEQKIQYLLQLSTASGRRAKARPLAGAAR
ncbi:response regulator [Roseimaritima ulvae]|uniref:Putative transcriptional regulatory protein TcrX n=1 Tax=Roseimaritima ulvae TaxID=980254 RepID=A0A5B9QMR5_9BACT|nr:response regulator [Roseimaritima ulvae]QEG38775.1 putative transcriptional regulatory protein TcrX [Roseimaritima ulvae]